MASYSIEKRLTSCFVTKQLLLEIEKYILKKISEIANEDINKIREDFSFIIYDKYGFEKMEGVEEYQRELFPSDTKKICLQYRYLGSPSIKLSLGNNDTESKIEIDLDIKNSKEIANGIINEITSQINETKNMNFIFHGFYQAIPFTTSPLILILTITELYRNNKNENFIFFLLLLSIIIIFYYILKSISPYCIISTKRNENLQKAKRWLLNGMGSLLVFGLIGSYLRKKLLGI